MFAKAWVAQEDDVERWSIHQPRGYSNQRIRGPLNENKRHGTSKGSISGIELGAEIG